MGTKTADPTLGDCHGNQCDGAGNEVSVVDDTDTPATDGNDCTTEVCTAGVPSHKNADAGSACNQNGGVVCDDATTSVCTSSVQVVKVGDGAAALSSVATAVFLEQRFVTTGGLVPTGHNPLALPKAATGNNNARLTVSGSATSEGALRLSVDGHYVTLAGYDADAGTTGVVGMTVATVNRIIGRVDAAGTVDTTTRITNLFDKSNARSVVTADGSAFWASGSANGVVYVPFGGTTATQILAAPASMRWVDISGGQLYGTSGSAAFSNVFTVGTGLPTASGATAKVLPGMPTTGTHSPYAFSFAGAGANVLYVADDGSIANGGGVQKWTLANGTWSLLTTFNGGLTGGARGLTTLVSGANVIVLATTAVASGNSLVSFLDDGVNLTPTATVLATAPANTVFRGVALSPN